MDHETRAAVDLLLDLGASTCIVLPSGDVIGCFPRHTNMTSVTRQLAGHGYKPVCAFRSSQVRVSP